KAADVKKEKGEENGKIIENKKAKGESPAKVNSDDVKKILRDWRVMVIIVLCIGSIIVIAPHIQDGKLATDLQWGLDLQGGAWLQLEFNSVIAGFDTDRPVQDFISDLQKKLDAEVTLVDNNKVEIRKLLTEQEISSAITANGGHLVSYQQGVSQNTADDVKRILEDKLNSLGTQDARVNTLTDLSGVTRYVRVELAGVDMSTARDIVGKQGKFEIRIVTENNQTEHVLFGDAITSVGVPEKNPQGGVWGVPFTLSEDGANAFRQAALTYGAVNDPDNHHLVMLLDNKTVYSAPLSTTLADQLRTGTVRSLSASTGAGDEGLSQAQALEIHLRAGALPVEVSVAGSGSVPAALGDHFKAMCLYAGILAVLTVGAVVFYRYRESAIVLPMMAITGSEILILLGIARFIQQLDLAAIAGIIAVMGTGIDQLVVITDEVLHEGRVPSTNLYLKRLTRALSIIVVAASTVVIAMVPLVLMDLSTLKGFAIITIIGVIIGVV
ncbi:MAG TPA: preprotein translocase subunit SecD, partial [Methanomicrobiales archaeon]|nr:preprotein translocase subunit SecD [Methanomicrobiales archaeon]